MTRMSGASARERIVASALALFAERGPDAVTMRDIAAHAQVSAALIPHHFGSAVGLRQAVDDHVMRVFEDLGRTLADGDSGITASGFVDALLAGLPPGSPVPRYLRRLLLSGSPTGTTLFARWHTLSMDLLSELTAQGIATPSDDPPVRAAFLLANDLSMILLHDHIAAVIGVDPLTPEGSHRWATDAVDAYSTGVFRREPE